jgi:AcrR family transcriptional regulator
MPGKEVLPLCDAPARGRKRDASRDDALRQATIELLAEFGYDRLTIEAVAARAGAGKATVYRRWANKAELVADALAQRHAAMPVPDTGSVRGDLLALIDDKGNAESQEFRTRLFSGLIPALVENAELRVAFQRVRGADTIEKILERGVERGEIAAPKNAELLAALFPAVSLYRFVMFGESHDRTFARTFVDSVLMPLVLGQAPPPARPLKSI